MKLTLDPTKILAAIVTLNKPVIVWHVAEQMVQAGDLAKEHAKLAESKIRGWLTLEVEAGRFVVSKRYNTNEYTLVTAEYAARRATEQAAAALAEELRDRLVAVLVRLGLEYIADAVTTRAGRVELVLEPVQVAALIGVLEK